MLPGPYQRWFIELAGRPPPVETRSTCEHCAMDPGAPELPPSGPFDPALRCCTYHPHLAPHLVGGILAVGSDAGRAIVRARLAARISVTPIGLGPTPDWTAAQGRAGVQFGVSRELLCPFHDAGRCTIWQHRGAPCAGFHCKYDRGAVSAGLWHLLVVGFNVVERALARWLLARQGLDATLCDALLHAPLDTALDQRAWGRWYGREEAYFLEAAALIEPLGWAEVAALGGRDLPRFADAVRAAVAQLDAPLPARVRPSPERLHQIGRPGQVRYLHAGLPFDPLEVPAEVVARLPAGPADRAGLGLDPELTRRLLDWQVLLPG